MDFLKTWLGRIIIAVAGVITIAASASAHGPKEAAGIVTGIVLIVFAIYATIRGLTGDAQGSDDQVIGLVNVNAWYDFVVVGGLIVVCAIAWAV